MIMIDGIYGNNRNVLGKSHYIMDTVTISRSTDILAIVEESSVNNSDGRIELNSIDLYNFTISDSQGTIDEENGGAEQGHAHSGGARTDACIGDARIVSICFVLGGLRDNSDALGQLDV